MKILVAEDDSITRTFIVDHLLDWGYRPVVAETGLTAWAEIQKKTAPKLLLLDWQMPGLTGFEICQKLESQPNRSEFYIIMLTALNDKIHVVKGLEAGANDYLTKPFNPYELRIRIQNGRQMIERQMELLSTIERMQKESDSSI